MTTQLVYPFVFSSIQDPSETEMKILDKSEQWCNLNDQDVEHLKWLEVH